MNTLLATVLGLNLLLGNLCMAPTTAHAMDPLAYRHTQVSSENMSMPMTQAHPMQQQTCGAGHCLSQAAAQEAISSVSAPRLSDVKATVSAASIDDPSLFACAGGLAATASPPPFANDVRTIVLRQ